MMNYRSVQEMAEFWQLSERQVQRLCSDGRVSGARRFGNNWMIPRIHRSQTTCAFVGRGRLLPATR